MAVRLALRHELGGDGAIGAGLVLDHRRLAEQLLEFRTDGAPDDVGGAAGDERDDHPDGLGRERLREPARAHQRGRQGERERMH